MAFTMLQLSGHLFSRAVCNRLFREVILPRVFINTSDSLTLSSTKSAEQVVRLSFKDHQTTAEEITKKGDFQIPVVDSKPVEKNTIDTEQLGNVEQFVSAKPAGNVKPEEKAQPVIDIKLDHKETPAGDKSSPAGVSLKSNVDSQLSEDPKTKGQPQSERDFRESVDVRTKSKDVLATKKVLKNKREILISNPSTHLILQQPSDGSARYIGKAERPLVLLFRWLYSTPQAVNKYCSLYHDIGLDVAMVKGKLAHFLWPPKGVKLANEVFNFLNDHRPPKEPILIHAFSIGAYNYAVATHQAAINPESSVNFRNRVVGQIFDSVVIGSFEKMSDGISQILPENQAFKRAVMGTLQSYYHITQHSTKDVYNGLLKLFKEDPIPVPTLFYYSKDDVMCDPESVEDVLTHWRSKRPDMDLKTVSWTRSKHVRHLRLHHDEYIAAWLQLMNDLQLV